MVNSMTAYARKEQDTAVGRLSCEIRTVNHRYLDLSLRLPEDMRSLEPLLRELISSRVNRGKVEVSIRSLGQGGPSTHGLRLNEKLLSQIQQCGGKLAQSNFTEPSWLDILRWPGMLEDEKFDEDALKTALTSIVDDSLNDLVAARRREGAKLVLVLQERLKSMESVVKKVQALLPEILQAQREKLWSRLAEIKGEVDQNRLEQEVLYLAQRMDVDEELQRLLVHMDEIRKTLQRGEPIGRRLDFLMQELNREANTLSSKSVHAASSNAAVELKVFIEQMREQVQNIE